MINKQGLVDVSVCPLSVVVKLALVFGNVFSMSGSCLWLAMHGVKQVVS